MKKIPGVFANKINKQINNNEKIYFSANKSTNTIEKKDSLDKNNNFMERIPVNRQIKEIFDSNNYIYKADVIIKTKDKNFEKRIVGKNGQYLITMDNELIPISDIVEIKNKNE